MTPLRRSTALRSSSEPKLKRSPLGPTTQAQKDRVLDRPCLNCGHSSVDPAHVIPRAACPGAMADDERAVIALCRTCHKLYDQGKLDLSPLLEPFYRDSQAWAVECVGFWRAARFITGRPCGPREAA